VMMKRVFVDIRIYKLATVCFVIVRQHGTHTGTTSDSMFTMASVPILHKRHTFVANAGHP
jgi:hypothetical protein